jgi:amidase
VPHYPSLAKTGVKGLRICRLSEGLDRPLADKRVSDLVVKAAKALAELGAVVDELSVPFHKEASDVWAVSQFALLILVWTRLSGCRYSAE